MVRREQREAQRCGRGGGYKRRTSICYIVSSHLEVAGSHLVLTIKIVSIEQAYGAMIVYVEGRVEVLSYNGTHSFVATAGLALRRSVRPWRAC